MAFTVRELRVDDLADARRLADMWNASNEGWPGGWNRGLAITAEQQLDSMRRADHIAALVVESGDEFLGYASICETRGREDKTYLGLLNVRPNLHGQGYGKALILGVLERTVALGRQQLTLGTWPGNLKAVPLYKKTGFFWRPETSVSMQNFIPTALQAPLGREFFARHAWYDSFQRELVVAPDDIDWHGIKVYPYRFEADGDVFAFWVDRDSEAPVAMENNDVYVACYTELEEVVCGLPHTVTWEFRNKRPETGPRRIALLAGGDDGLEVHVTESFEVADTLTVARPFRVTPDLDRRPPGLPERAIRSTVLVDGLPVQLGHGVKAVQPVEISVDGLRTVAGKPNGKVVVKLRNRLDQPVRGEVRFAPASGLELEPLSQPFSAPARSWTSARFALRLPDDGACATTVQAVLPPADNAGLPLAGHALATRRQPVIFHTTPLDRLIWWPDPEHECLCVETPSLALRIELRGGQILVYERPGQHQLLYLPAPSVGPPFVSWHYAPPLYDYRVEPRDGVLMLTVIMPMAHLPGVSLQRRLTIGAGPFLRLDHQIANATDSALSLQFDAPAHSNVQAAITMPRREGLLHELPIGWGEFPIWGGEDVTKQTADFTESWLAQGDETFVTGVVWSEAAECQRLSLLLELGELPAHTTRSAPTYHLVAGRGDWELVRTLWRRLYQPADVIEEHRPTAVPVLEAAFEPAVSVLTGPQADLTLAVHNRRGKAFTGRWELLADGVTAEPAAGELSGLDRSQPTELAIMAKLADCGPRIVPARVRLTGEVDTTVFDTPLVVLGDASAAVSRDEQAGLFTIANGHLTFQVAPGHRGSVVSLVCADEELLHSSYPEPGPYLTDNPWHGGVCPHLNWRGDLRFAQDVYRGEWVSRQGTQGVSWTGVKLSCDASHKDWRWLRQEIEYLTCPGAAVVAVVRRLINTTDAPQGVQAGFAVWLAEGDEVERVLHLERNRPRYEPAGAPHDLVRTTYRRTLCDHEVHSGAPCWVAAENARTGRFLTLVAPQPGGWTDCGADDRRGAALGCAQWLSLEPGETKERLAWLAVSSGREQAGAYGVLGRFTELP